jgi:hypothetical protein
MSLVEDRVGYRQPIEAFGFNDAPLTIYQIRRFAGRIIHYYEGKQFPCDTLAGFLPEGPTPRASTTSLLMAFRSRGYDLATTQPDAYDPAIGDSVVDITTHKAAHKPSQPGSPIQKAARYLLQNEWSILVGNDELNGLLLPGEREAENATQVIDNLGSDAVLHAVYRDKVPPLALLAPVVVL